MKICTSQYKLIHTQYYQNTFHQQFKKMANKAYAIYLTLICTVKMIVDICLLL